ncbi:MAG: hypothetical protein ACOYN0_00175 [Phycisphaerales bacterium]
MRTVRLLCLAASAALCFSAVAQEQPASAPAAPQVSPATAPKITLLDAGQADGRRALRFKPVAGSRETMLMRMKLGMSISMGGRPMPKTDIPAQEITMAIAIASVENNGDIHYNFEFSGAKPLTDESTPPAIKSAMEEAMKKLVGFKGNAVVSNRGITISLAMQPGEKADAQTRQLADSMNQSLQQISAPVPEEEVGTGAKWLVEINPTVGGISQKILSTYTVVSMTDTTVKLKVDLVQSAGEQPLDAPGMPPGTKATVMSVAGTGSGAVEFSFSNVSPRSATITAKAKIETVVGAEGQQTAMSQEVTTDVSVTGSSGTK